MKYRTILRTAVSALCGVLLFATPLSAIAEGEPILDEVINPVIITELQTGAATASEEFVELYNTLNEPVDITGWQVRFANANGTPDTTSLLATITAPEGTRIIMAGYSYFVLHTPSVTLPTDVAGQVYAAVLSKTDKTVALFARDETVCQMIVQDAVAWETVPGTTLGEGPAVQATSANVNIDKLLQRYVAADETYVDTNNNANDFLLAAGTPGTDNPKPIGTNTGGPGTPSALQPFAASNCTLPPSEDPPEEDPPVPDPPQNEPPLPDPNEDPPIPPNNNEGLNPVQVSELLPNPGPSHVEPGDEFIELYNPNDAAFNLAGYTIEVGVSTTYRYTFTEGTLAPHAYRAFFYPETNTRLVNSNGQVRILDPSGTIIAQSDIYGAAADDKAWALIANTWQWATTPTPNAVNMSNPEEEEEETPPGQTPPPVVDPPGTPPDPNAGLITPELSELLPAPGTGQLEFVELYNPNDTAFDLSGYVLESGTTTKYRYTFASGTLLGSKTFMALFSDQTKLTLANKAGQVRLIDPAGAITAESGAYSDAKENQAWIFKDGLWQWSTSPTPNAINVLTAPTPKVKSATTSSASKKKATTPKDTSKTKSKTSNDKEEDNEVLAALTKPSDPLHPGVLAAIGVFAVLYGAYEYRNDLASRIRQFRANRAARAAVGAGAKGR